jgi:hypothetical protein
VLSFVQTERLHWENATPSGDQPFTNPSDYKILYNDWPYSVEASIKHLVVWTKFLLEDDEETDNLTPRAREEIEDFVSRTLCGEDGVPRDQLIWFKNWRSLKSVHALGMLPLRAGVSFETDFLEHFHIMLYKTSEEFLDRITQRDRPMSVVLSEETK